MPKFKKKEDYVSQYQDQASQKAAQDYWSKCEKKSAPSVSDIEKALQQFQPEEKPPENPPVVIKYSPNSIFDIAIGTCIGIEMFFATIFLIVFLIIKSPYLLALVGVTPT